MVVSRSGLIWCEDERRSGVLREPAHPLNGIDYVEYRRDPLAPPGERNVLDVTFLKPPPVAPALTATNFDVIGGVRIVGIRVLDVAPDAAEPLRLNVCLDQEGDFSSYVLRIEHPAIDAERSESRFGFKAGCPTEFDCRTAVECPPEALTEPALDYLAKDYQSFRRLMVDLIAERNPNWQERLPADLGMTLVELSLTRATISAIRRMPARQPRAFWIPVCIASRPRATRGSSIIACTTGATPSPTSTSWRSPVRAASYRPARRS